jgi:ferric-dicitrate binding protein FerR (iron transport regulator)
MSMAARRTAPRPVAALLAAAALAVMIAPGPARAATAGTSRTGGTIDYATAPGERNQLTASGSGPTITLSDPGATITARSGCTSV